MDLIEWIETNDRLVDWGFFAEPWDSMQLRHNPFRTEQIDAMLSGSGILDKEQAYVLDLGCGPGILGRCINNARPNAHYVGVDGDPLMLAAARHLLTGVDIQTQLVDLRGAEWTKGLANHFDSVVSLTALHWLSQVHQRVLYEAVFQMLKPGGTFMIGDPYQPEDLGDKRKLQSQQEQLIDKQDGRTWTEFWESFFEKYPVQEIYVDYHKSKGYQEPFEGSEEGYPLSFQMKALQDAGFAPTTVYWKEGLRAVYGGTKPDR
jgi:SAM-dependent methyltransferase